MVPEMFQAFVMVLAMQQPAAAEPALLEVAPPQYPVLASQARVSGEVMVRVVIGIDGAVHSAERFSGHPLLAPAALESARLSTFTCANCSAPTEFLLIFSFEAGAFIRDGCDSQQAPQRETRTSHAGNRITVAGPAVYLCPGPPDPSATSPPRRVRSARCLYIWKCRTPVIAVE
ncbi:MAG: energy transducer TonB [Bryobacteraceae bacterium]